jgi:hypothetical protein
VKKENEMKRFFLVGFAILILGIGIFAQEPLVDKMSIKIYFRAQRAEAEWRWTPKIDFNIFGKAADSVIWTVEYTLPNGKPFVKIDCSDNGNSQDTFSNVENCGNDLEWKDATNLTGNFGFQIRMTDELNSINKVLYSGKFTVNKILYNPAKNPAFNKNFYYYVDYDWRMTTAYVGAWQTEFTPRHLFTWLWVKKSTTNLNSTGYLFYNGKKIGEASPSADMSYTPEENENADFTRLRFEFNAVYQKADAERKPDWWKLYENPGEYEIKILRAGELSRVLKFSIGKDGLVQTNIGKEVHEGYGGIIVPVQISGTTDGTLNQTILKSGWWGNPISGLVQ